MSKDDIIKLVSALIGGIVLIYSAGLIISQLGSNILFNASLFSLLLLILVVAFIFEFIMRLKRL